MPSNDAEDTARYADMLAALGSEPRLRIVRLLLAAHPEGLVVGEIGSELGIPPSTLSHHLDKLKNEGLVTVRRESTFLRYTANTRPFRTSSAFCSPSAAPATRRSGPKPSPALSRRSMPCQKPISRKPCASATPRRRAACKRRRSSCCDDARRGRTRSRPISTPTTKPVALPEEAVLASLGCGNPTALAELKPGETVLDLGSGGGIDVLLSARRVGPTGKAYGLDMTDDMLALARENQKQGGRENVEFLKGEIEAIPLPDNSVDVIISNCVINLSADKDRCCARRSAC